MYDLRDPAFIRAMSGHRTSEWYVDLVDAQDNTLRRLNELDASSGGQIEQNRFRNIRGGGSLKLVAPPNSSGRFNIDWGRARFRVMQRVEGLADPIPWGVFLPDVPQITLDDDTGLLTAEVTLMDKMAILDQDMPDSTFSLPAGTNITDAVTSIMRNLGQERLAVTPSDEVLKDGRSYPVTEEEEVSWLNIVNDLLSIAGYFATWVDAEGVYQISPYRPYQGGPPAWTFEYGPNSLYSAEWDRLQDWGDVPNKVILVGAGDEGAEALSSTVINDDPESPFSTVNRGRAIVRKETGVEASSQAVLDTLAARRLTSLSGAVSNIEASTAPIPIWPNTTVRFVPRHGEVITCTVSSWTLNMTPDALQNHSWREVTTL